MDISSWNESVNDLAISRANLTAVVGFKAPFLFKKAQRSPCKIHAEIKTRKGNVLSYNYISVKLSSNKHQRNAQGIMFHAIVG